MGCQVHAIEKGYKTPFTDRVTAVYLLSETFIMTTLVRQKLLTATFVLFSPLDHVMNVPVSKKLPFHPYYALISMSMEFNSCWKI